MKRTKRLLAAILSCAMVFALTACGGSEGAGSGSLKAVSYTHLDVYKRQAQYRLTARM